ncbi:MAG: sugar phosphate isomerase/epimerase family protein [Halobacteriaceae archaeon]
MRTAINLYSVRELSEPMLDVIDRVADAGYDGVQISGGFGNASAEEVAERIEHHGLGVTGAHVGMEQMENDLDGVLEDYVSTLGCESLVVPYLGEEHFESHEAVDETAAGLDALAGRLAARDVGLHYHNHAHEFVDLDGGTAFDRLVEASDVGIELDVGWAQTGGADPVDLLYELDDRVDLVHMKDMDAERGQFREIGEGDVDMLGCAEAARDVGAEWLIYEHDEPADPVESLEYGAEFLNDVVGRL